MLRDKLKSPRVKLFILLIVLLVLFVVFFVIYVKDYLAYYKNLYDYREGLISSLTQTNVQKPVYNTGDPIMGSSTADIVIFEYGDFSCQACAALQPVLDQVEDFYGSGNILVIWKDLPITKTGNNMNAHQAAHCAADQKSFFPYKDLLFQNQNNFSQDLFIQLAADLNLNVEEFTQCLETEKHKATVENNFRDALRLGLDSTPSLFINNQEVRSGFNFQNLRNIIESTK